MLWTPSQLAAIEAALPGPRGARGRLARRSEPVGGAEPVGRRDDRLAHRRAAAVAGVVDQDELAVRPGVREQPGRAEQVADVEAALHDHSGDAVQPGRVAQHLPLGQPGPGPPVVRHDPRERHPEVRVRVAAVRPRRGRDDRLLPVAPGPGRARAHRGSGSASSRA